MHLKFVPVFLAYLLGKCFFLWRIDNCLTVPLITEFPDLRFDNGQKIRGFFLKFVVVPHLEDLSTVPWLRKNFPFNHCDFFLRQRQVHIHLFYLLFWVVYQIWVLCFNKALPILGKEKAIGWIRCFQIALNIFYWELILIFVGKKAVEAKALDAKISVVSFFYLTFGEFRQIIQ